MGTGITDVTAAQSANIGHWDYIDALRGIAAFGVLVLHALILFPQLPFPISQISRLGLHGVQLFFMVSAITLTSSWKSRARYETNPVPAFFIRRFFRIAPMFWASLVGYLLLNAAVVPFWTNQGTVTPLAVLLTTLFVHGWLPQTINVVVPGGWSIADEMTFYLIFPFLVTRITSLAWAIMFFVASVIMTLLSNWLALSLYGPQTPHFEQFIYYWLPNQLPIFALGFMTFYLIRWARGISRRMAIILLGVAIALLLIVAFGNLPYSADISHPMIWRDLPMGAAFMALILSLAAWPSKLLVNRGTKLLGRVSFSSYLLQFGIIELFLALFGPTQISGFKAALLFVMAVILLACINTLLSMVTYRLIEEPWIKIGHRFARLCVLRTNPQGD
jgi:peptidoglycan/LPS O-acetylase OafA/YrhL